MHFICVAFKYNCEIRVKVKIESGNKCQIRRDEKMAAGDIAWVITATALVMLMTPALGFFYGGLVRRKNLVSTIVQCFIIFAVISIIWALWGYCPSLWNQYQWLNRLQSKPDRIKWFRYTCC